MENPYTIHLSKEELARFDNISPYTYMSEEPTPEVFRDALYPIFNYYIKKTPFIETVQTSTAFTDLNNNKTLFISTYKNFWQKFLKRVTSKGNCLYLNEKEALLDVERTWRIVTEQKDISKYDRVVFDFQPWTKIVYAYRIATVYDLKITDVTNY